MPRKKSYYNHTHRYEKVALGRKHDYIVFRCNLPECAHFIAEAFAKGKLSVCNRCGKEFILNYRAMTLVKPHCDDCVEVKLKRNEKEKFDALSDFLLEKEI